MARCRACRAASSLDASSRCSSAKGTSSSLLIGRRLAEMSPKTLTGAELQLDDAPARESDLFLVDGNNLAYRAFFALPEELATSEGFSTNALLGFTNMLFKLLADYRPKGVAVAWDTRPVHRTELLETYKVERKPMPDLLREQFPHFRPIVEAFGYRNLEFEGWEADDVIATLAHLADEAGIRTCVVSTDRDAFQLVSENVCLMMTPRGVSDVHVYTPERVEARLGITPDKVPDFIALKGDPSDNIPGVPGIGDKTAGQLVAQYGSLEDVLEHVDDLTPARSKAIREHAEQAQGAKVLATMRRDLELDCDPAELVLSPPDRSKLKEIFRRFEFRNLLGRVDELDAAVPAAAVLKPTGVTVPWREELSNSLLQGQGSVAVAVDNDRVAAAAGEEVVVSPRPERIEGELVADDVKSVGVDAVDDTMILAYLIEPGRAEYDLDDLAAEYGIELVPEPEAEEETAALVRQAAATLRLRDPLLERVRERGAEGLYREIELPLPAGLAAMERAAARAATGRPWTPRPNLRAIPIRTDLGREIRSAFGAEPGCKLVSADYSQVELRILAHVSGEPKLREAFEHGEDIHRATAAEVLGKDPATLTKDERNVAKMVNFGIIYGISSFGLSENLEIPREEAQAYIDSYLARFPHVQDFIQRTIEQAARDGYVTTLFGRRRPVPEIRASNRQTRSLGERLAVNSVMQGTAADVIKRAMVAIHDRLLAEGRSARLVLQVHDELLLEGPETEVAPVQQLVREVMVDAFQLDRPLEVDVGARV